MYNKILCITGCDGTGKSTIIENLAKEIPNAYVAHIWDALQDSSGKLFSSKEAVDDYLCGLTPNSRVLFLAHALKYSVDKGLKSNAQILIIDSYYYKYFASELTLGADKKLICNLIENFTKPDIIVKLELTPDIVLGRKEIFSRYECGLAEKPTKEAFYSFQKQVINQWEFIKDENEIALNTTATIEETTTRILHLIA